MIFMGHSNCGCTGSTISNRISRLFHLYEDLSGIQQSGIGPSPEPRSKILADEIAFQANAEQLIRDLAEDFGVEIEICGW